MLDDFLFSECLKFSPIYIGYFSNLNFLDRDLGFPSLVIENEFDCFYLCFKI